MQRTKASAALLGGRDAGRPTFLQRFLKQMASEGSPHQVCTVLQGRLLHQDKASQSLLPAVKTWAQWEKWRGLKDPCGYGRPLHPRCSVYCSQALGFLGEQLPAASNKQPGWQTPLLCPQPGLCLAQGQHVQAWYRVGEAPLLGSGK